MIDVRQAFEEVHDEYLKFSRVANKLSPRPDVCAFLLLDRLLPTEGNCKMVCHAEHDEYWLDVDCDELGEVATLDDIRSLARCGVRYDDLVDSLALFT